MFQGLKGASTLQEAFGCFVCYISITTIIIAITITITITCMIIIVDVDGLFAECVRARDIFILSISRVFYSRDP